MFGGFHYPKIIPRCIGCYISSSAMDDVIIKAEVFEKRSLVSIITIIIMSVQSILMMVNVTNTLSWEVFFLANDTQSMLTYYSGRCFWARRMPKSHVPHFTHAVLAYQVQYLPD